MSSLPLFYSNSQMGPERLLQAKMSNTNCQQAEDKDTVLNSYSSFSLTLLYLFS